jgi:TatD DNase family protein
MKLIDTHCHLYLKDFDKDRNEILKNAHDKGVQKFYLPCIDSSVVTDMISMEKENSGSCFLMMGLHPCSVKENVEEELELVKNWLQNRAFAAVGEIGLDFYWDTSFKEQQIVAFNTQMQWAIDYKLPIVIHSRNAMQETINLVKPFASKGLKGIFHCFSGNEDEAKQIIDMGFLLGIGGVVTYKKSGLADVLKEIDLKNIVVETDAPYLSPVPFRGKRNESAYLEYIVNAIATIKQTSAKEVGKITTYNAENLFNDYKI